MPVHAGLLGKAVTTTANAWVQVYVVPTTLTQNGTQYNVAFASLSANINNGTGQESVVDLAFTTNTALSTVDASDLFYNQYSMGAGVLGANCNPASPGEVVGIRSSVPGIGIQVRGMLQLYAPTA